MMNEFDFEVRQRKQIANQARHRKCGSKSRKCSLSTDRMTQKQWIERCGKVVSFQIGKPMKWAEFCELPKDLKEEYINSLIEKYSVTAKVLASMFGVSPVTVFRLVEREQLSVGFSRGKRMDESEKIAFEKFLSGKNDELPRGAEGDVGSQICEDTLEKSESATEECLSPERPSTKLNSFTLNFSGGIDIEMIANSLRYILGDGTSAKIQISCELV